MLQPSPNTLRALDRARGPARVPLRVVAGKRLQPAGYRPPSAMTRRPPEADVKAGILASLGAAEDDGIASAEGLFSWQQRRFGEGAHGSQIVGAIQNVPGVRWVDLVSASTGGITLRLLQRRRFRPVRLPEAEWRAIASSVRQHAGARCGGARAWAVGGKCE